MKRIPRFGETRVVVDVPVEAVWDVVSDPTRIGSWSAECYAADWLGSVRTAMSGARFRGCNRSGWLRWSRVCEILTVDPPKEIAWRTVPTLQFPDSTEWRIRLLPSGEGTEITQTFRVTRMPRAMEAVLSVVNPSHLDRRAALEADLHRLGAVAAGARV